MSKHMKVNPWWGSHLPVLMAVVSRTRGPIVELGSGLFSTPYLHWACFTGDRQLVTIESDPAWYAYAKRFEKPWHQIICITPDEWDSVDLSRAWSVALVDHAEEPRRWEDIVRLAHSEYVLAHDAENRYERKYHYSRCHKSFKYRAKYDRTLPATAVFSNLHDVRGLVI